MTTMIEWNETRTCTFRNIFVWLVLMLASHFVFQKTGMYWVIRELDLIPHFLGGMTLFFGVMWLFIRTGVQKVTMRNMLLGSLLGVLTLAILFEVGQYIYNIYCPYKINLMSDTIYDVLIGFAGGLAAAHWWRVFCKYEVRKTL